MASVSILTLLIKNIAELGIKDSMEDNQQLLIIPWNGEILSLFGERVRKFVSECPTAYVLPLAGAIKLKRLLVVLRLIGMPINIFFVDANDI